jgi:hypothetical protein
MIAHPKGELKTKLGSFDEIADGEQIMRHLDVPHLLSRPETCASLRTLFGWCWRALGLPPGEDYQLAKGCYFDVTQPQIEQLPLGKAEQGEAPEDVEAPAPTPPASVPMPPGPP